MTSSLENSYNIVIHLYSESMEKHKLTIWSQTRTLSVIIIWQIHEVYKLSLDHKGHFLKKGASVHTNSLFNIPD